MKAPDHLQHHFADIYTDRGNNVEEQFLRDLCNVQDIIADLWHHHSQTPMDPLTPVENTFFKEAQKCYICQKPFKYEGTLDEWVKQRKELKEMNKISSSSSSSRKRKIDSEDSPKLINSEDSPKFKNLFKCPVDEMGPRVRDHDHFSGKYRGAAHAKCNIQMKSNKNRTPFLYHNGGKYDCKVWIFNN